MVLLVLLAGCGKEAPETVTEVIRPVKTITVGAAEEGLRRSFSGTVRAGREAALAFQVAGKVAEIAVAVGDRVAGDQLLARLDPYDYQLMVTGLESNLAAARAAAKNSQAAYRRHTRLYENSTISKAELDLYEVQRDSDLAQVEALAAQLEQAKNQLDYTRLRAPFPGYISARRIEEHETVAAGQQVFTLVDPVRLKIVLGMPERLIARVQPSAPVGISLEILPGKTVPGVVTEIGVALDPAIGSYPVTVEIADPPPELRPGMAAEAVFTFGFPSGAGFVVPTSALLQDMLTGGNYLWVIEEGAARRRTVETGSLVSDGVEIISGLSPGDVVVVAGANQAEEGMKLRVLE